MHASERTQAPLLRFPTGRSSQLETMVQSVREALALHDGPTEEIPPKIASILSENLPARELLTQSQRQPDANTYRRHTIYRDPDGQFTIMALVWLPGQETPAHGHMSWGAVGMYSGELNIKNFEIFGTRAGSMHLQQVDEFDASAGATAFVNGGINDIHRIRNNSDLPAISIHIYGMDVPPESQALNILFPQ